jgi:hypothetical protein
VNDAGGLTSIDWRRCRAQLFAARPSRVQRLAGRRASPTLQEALTIAGKRFRNNEILTVKNGKIIEIKVYFGWSLPHDAPEESFVSP